MAARIHVYINTRVYRHAIRETLWIPSHKLKTVKTDVQDR